MTKQIHIDLSGDKLLPHQRKLINSKSKKTALICGRGAGKSYACAALVLLTLIRGKNVLVGGQRYETLQTTLYSDIKNLAQEWGLYDLIEWRLSPMMMTLGDYHVWFGSYESIDAVRGYSRVSLIVLDEGFLSPVNILSVWGPCMRATGDGAHNRIVLATTPRGGSLWNVMFADPKCDWEIVRAVTTDNTHIEKEEYDLIMSSITSDEMYRQEILGQISTELSSAIIKLGEFPLVAAPTTDDRVIAGLDCSDGVDRDATAFVVRKGTQILEMWKSSTIGHEEIVRRVLDANKQFHITKLNMDMAFSDYEFNVLKYELPCEQVNFARAATDENRERYANCRSEMFFNLAQTIRNGLCVNGFDLSSELKRQLCAIGWFRNNQNRLLLTKKEELREVLKMSTDVADALALTCLDLWKGDDPVMRQNMKKASVSREEEEEIMSEC